MTLGFKMFLFKHVTQGFGFGYTGIFDLKK